MQPPKILENLRYRLIVQVLLFLRTKSLNFTSHNFYMMQTGQAETMIYQKGYSASVISPPDGIELSHWEERRGIHSRANPTPLIILSLIMVVSLSGILGPMRHRATSQNNTSVLEVEGPRFIRTGEIFEMRIHITPRTELKNTVLSVSTDLWKDMTINTMSPAPQEESSENGDFRFLFGNLSSNKEFLVKVDLQINPSLRGQNHGTIRLLSNGAEINRVDYSIMVWP